MLKLTRPIVFFDIESTGIDTAKDRIVEICLMKVNPDGSQDVKTKLINPTIPIPKQASDIHGITDDDVKDSPTFKQISKSMLEFMEGCDLAGFNAIHYDVPLLCEEFLRCSINFPAKDVKVIDPGVIFKRREERTLTAALKFYCNKEHTGAHGAESDIKATFDVMVAQASKYSDLPMDLNELFLYCCYDKPKFDWAGKFMIDSDGDYCFAFGKCKGKKVKENMFFLNWMRGKDFSLDTMEWVEKIYESITGTIFIS